MMGGRCQGAASHDDANIAVIYWNTASSFAYPFSPVKPPRTRTKCDKQSAVMNARTDASGKVPFEGAEVTGSVSALFLVLVGSGDGEDGGENELMMGE